MPDSVNGWTKSAEHVRYELERLAKGQERMFQELVDLRVQVSTLRTKVAIYGGAIGFAAGLLATLFTKLVM